MKRSTLRLLGPLAIAGTALPGLTSTMTPASTVGPTAVTATPALLSGEELDPIINGIHGSGPGVALVMGGTGFPIPPEDLVQEAFNDYAVPNGFGDYITQIVFTPEGLQPIDREGIKSLPLDPSVRQGLTMLLAHIKSQLEDGNNVLVGGVSQSATINALAMRDIANGALGFQPTPEQLQFLSLGDPSNPNGGMLARFDLPIGSHPSIPSLGITFSGAAPADTGIPADIYTIEYDGFADFPRYPMNFVSDLNAVAGIAFAHPNYIRGGLTPEQIADAQVLPTTDGYDGGTAYYMIPDDKLPLAQLIEMIGGKAVKPLVDLLEPDLRVIANLGYGTDPTQGWSDGPANVATPIGLFPSVDSDQFSTIVQALVNGAKQGFDNFTADLSDPAAFAVPADLPNLADATDPPSFIDAVNALSSAAAQAYAVLLPTADIINGLVTALPAYDLNLFTHYLEAGDLVDAIGMPMAANTGLFAVAAGFEGFVLKSAIDGIQDTLSIFG